MWLISLKNMLIQLSVKILKDEPTIFLSQGAFLFIGEINNLKKQMKKIILNSKPLRKSQENFINLSRLYS